MKKMYCAVLGLALTLSTFLVSCEQEKNGLEPATSNEVVDIEKVRIEFSKALAQALKEKEVRQFLKNEALQKYDGDYDVLYAFVKDKKLTNGNTLEETLTKYANGSDVKNWSAQVPLMTVFIPNLLGFTPETWNVDSQTPDVVVDNSHLKEKTDTLVAFTSDLKEYDVDAKKSPSFPVVVVKENERIIAKSKLNSGARKTPTFFEEKSKQIIKEDNSNSFYFIGDVDPNIVPKKRDISKSSRNAADALSSIYYWKNTYAGNNQDNQRDWVYYNIFPILNNHYNPDINHGIQHDWSKGSFANFYTEKITGFKFNSPLGIQAVADNWTEGNLEFHIIIAFMHRDGGITTDLKTFFCMPNQLIDNSENPISYDPDVELMPWDIYRYGDEWKLSVMEHDAGGFYQKTVSAKSTFASNFEAEAGVSVGIVKFGAKFGSSSTFEQSASTIVNISSESDQLGDARFLYEYPVLTSWQDRFSVGTGSVNLVIEPVLKTQDNRYKPYLD